MPYSITNRCICCDSCLPLCPTGAVKVEGDDYWIDPALCNNCQGYYEQPQCVVVCPVKSPVPLQPKKGRCKVDPQVVTSPDLFPDGKTNPFASAIVIWELCNILAQRQSLAWETNDAGVLCYRRQVNNGWGNLTFSLIDSPDKSSPVPLDQTAALATLENFDIRAACVHLIFAAHATGLDTPWEEEFVINDRQIEEYLGLDKRKDLSKPTKLMLIRELVRQCCQICVDIDWRTQGRVKGFSIQTDQLWQLQETRHHFQEDALGCKHLAGLTFRIRAGQWARYFLNKQSCREGIAFYQYGALPRSLLAQVMSIWQQHEGAARMSLWLLFKTKMGREQRLTVPTLMRVAYGEERVTQATLNREERKRLLRSFESDLEVLNHYGLRPVFDPVTYPPEIQPLWAKLGALPDDAEEALEFWMNDGSNQNRLTDAAPRGKWNRLMNARLSCFELPQEWHQSSAKKESKKSPKNSRRIINHQAAIALSAQQIAAARKDLQLSQRTLAIQIGKSQSWVRDVESGRLQVSLKDQAILRKVLGVSNSTSSG